VRVIDRGASDDFLKSYGGADGALFLIRPDGYIGFIGDSQSIRPVECYLERIYGEN
jgi:hypothetical protein